MPKSKLCKIIFFVTVFLFPAACSFATYPTTMHHAHTYGKENKNLGLDYSYEYEKDKSTGDITRTNEYNITFGYGLLDALDIITEVPLKYILNEGAKNYTGLDDVSAGIKWKFYDTKILSFAVYPEMTFPTGRYEDGVGNGRTTFAATLIATTNIDKFALHLSGRYQRNENKTDDRLDIWEIDVSPTVDLTDKMTLIGEVRIRRDTDKSNKREPVALSAGFSYDITKNLSINPMFKSEWENGDKKDLTINVGLYLKF